MNRFSLALMLGTVLVAGCSRSARSPQGEPDDLPTIHAIGTATARMADHSKVQAKFLAGNRDAAAVRPRLARTESRAVPLDLPFDAASLVVGPSLLISEPFADLVIPDLGPDSATELLPSYVEVDRVETADVPGPGVDTPVGGIGIEDAPGNRDPKPGDKETPSELSGSFSGSSRGNRKAILDGKGTDAETEKAIANALAWIAKQQKADGSWEFDGANKADRTAATAMSVLAFLGAGENHKTGKQYKANVEKGLLYLAREQTATGQVGRTSGMYAHALGALALCEAFGLTKDPVLQKRAQAAIDYIVKAQGQDGGWRYQPIAPEGDTSVFGWQMQALKSADLAGLTVPKPCLQKAAKFLDGVAADGGSQYGYTAKSQPTATLSAIGLLCRMYLGAGLRNAAIAKGVDRLMAQAKPSKTAINTYYLWYGTLLFQQVGGDSAKTWQDALKKALLENQVANQAEAGSWPKDSAMIGQCCGKLGTTCLSVLCLEVSYRPLPKMEREP